MKVKLRDILTPVSRAEPLESEKKYRILGVKWYAKGAWVKDEKYGADIKANSAYRVQEGDLIYNRLFAWKGSFAVISKDLDGSYVSNEFPALRCNEEMAYLDYIFLFLSQYDVWTAINKLSTGVASISRKRLKVQELLNLEVLLPPKNIQQKIINKYSQIDSFYSQLIKLQDKNAVFVKKLRQAILQLAVQGKLAPQDPNDEPASELLKRIKTEKAKLIAEGKIKKQKPLLPITEDEILYELPQGWEWVRLDELCTVTGGKRVPKGYQLLDQRTQHIYIRVTDMKKGTIDDNNLKYISNDVYEKIKKYIITKNDLYITIAGTIGQVGEVPDKFHNMNLTENAARMIIHIADKRFLRYLLSSAFIQNQFLFKVNQMAQPKLAIKRIETTIFPLPPLAEQKRIVSKVDQLMHVCDELETHFTQSQKDSEMLMQAVLQEAFS